MNVYIIKLLAAVIAAKIETYGTLINQIKLYFGNVIFTLKVYKNIKPYKKNYFNRSKDKDLFTKNVLIVVTIGFKRLKPS